MIVKKFRELVFCLYVLLFCLPGYTQDKTIAFTIDDVPNTILFESEDYSATLLQKIDSANIPAAIFINEGLIFSNDNYAKNIDLLVDWLEHEQIESGNHSFSHLNYTNTSFSDFTEDILKGEVITRKILEKRNKYPKYFRFPYNSLGKDSISQRQIADFLNERNYYVTPFTIGSSDYIYNALYKSALADDNLNRADSIAQLYLELTEKLLDFYESYFQETIQRNVSHIYLCHDNKLNADYFDELLGLFRNKGYSIVSLDKALEDPIYSRQNYYYEKHGVSWVYRWIKDKNQRMQLMRKEPWVGKEVYNLYQNKN
ncbi:polysaccharide deacetylase family protein [Fulvivirgaceae bacterium BMA10]|uniref:Polysaccharide deacetylase family protein n=1 Tax=Splendidivirga corallicola TaxID=3051826 RepID=A0ABT8KJY5_9BACT|nr:polysaccharide deacetylase family protein [Fulvivirgaceae bacterium BMA10]